MLVTKFETSILNIGLENNTCGTHKVLVEMLKSFGYIILAEDLKVGQYLGNREVTSVIQLVGRDLSPIPLNQVKVLCEEFTQECIAVYEPFKKEGTLVYHPEFKEENLEFDSNYFILPNELSIHTK